MNEWERFISVEKKEELQVTSALISAVTKREPASPRQSKWFYFCDLYS